MCIVLCASCICFVLVGTNVCSLVCFLCLCRVGRDRCVLSCFSWGLGECVLVKCKVSGFEWEEVHKLQAQCVANVTDLKPVMTLTSTKSDKLQHVSKEQQV